MACESQSFLGRDTTLEYFIGCGDVAPLEAQWKFIGALRSNSLSGEYDTVDATADDSAGSIREMLATYKSVTISTDGVSKRTDNGTTTNQIALLQHFYNPTATGGQPVVWLRRTDPRVTVIGYFLLSTYDLEAPYDEVSTFSIEATTTANSVFPNGLDIQLTPVV